MGKELVEKREGQQKEMKKRSKEAEAELVEAFGSLDLAGRQKLVAELNTKAKALATVRTESEKQVKATGDTAAAKNTNFAAWSDLITVTVVEAKKK